MFPYFHQSIDHERIEWILDSEDLNATRRKLTPHKGTEAIPACGPAREIRFLTCVNLRKIRHNNPILNIDCNIGI